MNKLLIGLMTLPAMLLSSGLFADDGDMPPPQDGMYQTLTMIAIALVFFYFILWRPEQKRRKALEDQRGGLKKGDRVTAMGILGTVLRVQENTVILKMYDGAKIEVLTGAITDVLPGNEADVKEKDA